MFQILYNITLQFVNFCNRWEKYSPWRPAHTAKARNIKFGMRIPYPMLKQCPIYFFKFLQKGVKGRAILPLGKMRFLNFGFLVPNPLQTSNFKAIFTARGKKQKSYPLDCPVKSVKAKEFILGMCVSYFKQTSS